MLKLSYANLTETIMRMAKMSVKIDSDTSDDSDDDNNSCDLLKLFAVVKTGDICQTIKLLRSLGPNISKNKITVLMVAVIEGYYNIVELLLNKGAVIYAKDRYGNTALHIAVEKKRADICGILTEKGANINALNNMKWTPLMLAVASGCQECLRRIMAAKGVDINIKYNPRDTATHIAIQESRIDSVEILLNTFQITVFRGEEKILEAFLKRARRSAANSQTCDMFAAIHLAAFNNHLDCLELLIKYKYDINIRKNTLQAELYRAVSRNYLKCVNQTDEIGGISIPNGIRRNYMKRGAPSLEEIVLYLVRKGTELDIKNNMGETTIDSCDDFDLKTMINRFKRGLDMIEMDHVSDEDELPRSEIDDLQFHMDIEPIPKTRNQEYICVWDDIISSR